MLAGAETYSVDLFRDILDAVQNAAGGTTYSNIYDLNQRIVYVYFFHDFEYEVVFDLDEELANGAHFYELPDLFPRNVGFELWALPQLDAFETMIEMRTATDTDPDVYDRYVGGYGVPDEIGWLSFAPASVSTIDILRANDRLYMSAVPEMLPLELRPQSETDFFYADLSPNIPNFRIAFVEDTSGSVIQAIIDFEGIGSVPFLKINSEVPTLSQLQLLAGETAEEPSGFGPEQLLWLLVPVVIVLLAFGVWRIFRRRSHPQ
jgi:hypothetical protein